MKTGLSRCWLFCGQSGKSGINCHYIPDFIVRLKAEPPLHLIIEVKGYDERADIKAQAAQKWVDAVTADGAYGRWAYALAKKPSEVKQVIVEVASSSHHT